MPTFCLIYPALPRRNRSNLKKLVNRRSLISTTNTLTSINLHVKSTPPELYTSNTLRTHTHKFRARLTLTPSTQSILLLQLHAFLSSNRSHPPPSISQMRLNWIKSIDLTQTDATSLLLGFFAHFMVPLLKRSVYGRVTRRKIAAVRIVSRAHTPSTYLTSNR